MSSTLGIVAVTVVVIGGNPFWSVLPKAVNSIRRLVGRCNELVGNRIHSSTPLCLYLANGCYSTIRIVKIPRMNTLSAQMTSTIVASVLDISTTSRSLNFIPFEKWDVLSGFEACAETCHQLQTTLCVRALRVHPQTRHSVVSVVVCV